MKSDTGLMKSDTGGLANEAYLSNPTVLRNNSLVV